jgi:hypothetical protein
MLRLRLKLWLGVKVIKCSARKVKEMRKCGCEESVLYTFWFSLLNVVWIARHDRIARRCTSRYITPLGRNERLVSVFVHFEGSLLLRIF